MAFSNGNYIFDSNFQQINPKDPRGQIIEGILVRQIEQKISRLPQKHRAEVAHNIDINKDGIIGAPEISVDADVTITPTAITIKPKRKKKSKRKALVVSNSSDVAVSDSNDTVPV